MPKYKLISFRTFKKWCVHSTMVNGFYGHGCGHFICAEHVFNPCEKNSCPVWKRLKGVDIDA